MCTSGTRCNRTPIQRAFHSNLSLSIPTTSTAFRSISKHVWTVYISRSRLVGVQVVAATAGPSQRNKDRVSQKDRSRATKGHRVRKIHLAHIKMEMVLRMLRMPKSGPLAADGWSTQVLDSPRSTKLANPRPRCRKTMTRIIKRMR
jgi:hypothetical protein